MPFNGSRRCTLDYAQTLLSNAMTLHTYHNILDYLRSITEGTMWHGLVYAVGGCCRDEVLNRPPNDIDLAVEYPNGGILFGRYLYNEGYTVGQPVEFARYGTSMLRLAQFPDEEIEIVQTRYKNYTAEATPENVTDVFGTMEQDAFRRDLTINALFRNVSSGRLFDPTGKGIADIADKQLRTPLSPADTFGDDPVRMLRYIRIAAQTGWDTDTDTFNAIRANIASLKKVKVERIRTEIEKMLCCRNVVHALQMLRAASALPIVIPGIEASYRTKAGDMAGDTLWTRIIGAMDYTSSNCTGDADLILRWAILLHASGLTARNGQKTYNNASADLLNSCAYKAGQSLRRLHYHSPIIKSVQMCIRNRMAVRNLGNPDTVKQRRITGLRRACINSRRMERLLQFTDALNHAADKNDNTVERLRIRIAQVNAEVSKHKNQ